MNTQEKNGQLSAPSKQTTKNNAEKSPQKGYSSNRLEQSKQKESCTVTEAKQKLDNMIEELNEKLVNHFKTKQEALLNQYKQQLIQQQRKLNQLKNSTNEEQIRAKMQERKSQLQKERNQLIQTNMYFSQKCEQYKQTYNKLVQQSKDLQKQIQFLDHQIILATDKRISLEDESGSATDRPHNPPSTTKKPPELPGIDTIPKPTTLHKTANTQSVRKVTKSLHLDSDTKSKRSNSTKILKKIDGSVLQKTFLQRVFQESVEEVKSRRKNKRVMPNLKGQQFTQIQKRSIMELFLGNEAVKKKLYEVIFGQNEKNFKRPLPMNQKVKISFDELGL